MVNAASILAALGIQAAVYAAGWLLIRRFPEPAAPLHPATVSPRPLGSTAGAPLPLPAVSGRRGVQTPEARR